MKTLIAIPSKGRVDRLAKRTMRLLANTGLPFKVFVEPQDFVDYSAAFGPQCIVQLPENNRGLGYAKKIIAEYARANEFDLIWKMDDDISGWTTCEHRMKNSPYSFEVTEDKLLNSQNMMRHILEVIVPKVFTHKRAGGISFPYRNELYDLTAAFAVNKRFQTSYICPVDVFEPPNCEAVSTFEDFYSFLWAMHQNKVIVRYMYAGIDCDPVGANSGGHQSFDRAEQARNEMNVIRMIHPALKARAVDKKWGIEPDLRSEFWV